MDYLSEITSYNQLELAWRHVKRKRKVTPGIDLVDIEEFERNCKRNLQAIAKKAKDGNYKFNLVVQKKIPKRKGSNEKRPIRIYTISDKVLQTSVRITLEKNRAGQCLFPETKNKVSVGYLDKNYYKGESVGVKLGIQKLRNFHKQGYLRFITADIKDFFEVIDRKKLKQKIFGRLNPDTSINYLIEQMLNPVVIEKDRYGNDLPTLHTSAGVAQGSVISPFFSNVYLMEFDIALQDAGILAVRYADDLIIAAKSMSHAKKSLEKVKEILKKTSSLEFHPDGSKKGPKIQNIYSGFDYLGVNIQKTAKSNRWSICPSSEKIKIQKEKISEELSPTTDVNLYNRIHKLNRSLSSWFSTYYHVGCTKKEMASTYSEFKNLYISHVGHLLILNKITDRKLTAKQMDFLGVMPPQIVFTRKINRNQKKI